MKNIQQPLQHLVLLQQQLLVHLLVPQQLQLPLQLLQQQLPHQQQSTAPECNLAGTAAATS